ncbi:MAG: alanine dehydrogenase, partial [Gemmatimonadota bacterium]
MNIGVPREIKTNENRISLRPAGAEILVQDGQEVWVEKDAGRGSGFADEEYARAGARIVDDPDELWAGADMILKVKEPIREEWPRMRPGQTIFTYFHFAASEELTRAVVDSGAVAIAYETVQEK